MNYLKKINEWLYWRGIAWIDLIKISCAFIALGFVIVFFIMSLI